MLVEKFQTKKSREFASYFKFSGMLKEGLDPKAQETPTGVTAAFEEAGQTNAENSDGVNDVTEMTVQEAEVFERSQNYERELDRAITDYLRYESALY